MKKTLILALACLAVLASSAAAEVMLVGIVDGDLSGGRPKAVELFVSADGTDLSEYNLRNANNGNSDWYSNQTDLSGTANAGDYLYACNGDGTAFSDWFGFAADFTGVGNLSINGDDVVGLFKGDTLIDVYGNLGEDGTGTAWEYMDGWAYRNDNTAPSTTFDAGDWQIENGVCDGNTTNAGCNPSMPVGTYQIPEPSTTAMLMILGLLAFAFRRNHR